MTRRQLQAIEWLESVGKASENLVRRDGFAVRTFDTLVDQGFVRRDYMPRTVGGPFKVYRLLADEVHDA